MAQFYIVLKNKVMGEKSVNINSWSGISGILGSLGSLFQFLFSRDYRAASNHSELTGAEREANAFTNDQRMKQNAFEQHLVDQAYQRQMDLDNTKYQRAVADAQAAGINPMLIAGAGVSGPAVQSGSAPGAGSSVSPGSAQGLNLGTLMQYSLAKQQMKQDKEIADRTLDIREKEANSNIRNKDANTKGQDLDNAVKEATLQARIDAQNLSNDLSRAQLRQVDALVDKIAAETDESASRRLLNEASAYQIVQLLPYEQALRSAQTEEARQAAGLAAVQRVYQMRLIDSGYIEAQVREANASASVAEVNEATAAIELALRSGNFEGTAIDTGSSLANSVLGGITSFVSNTLALLQPVGSVVGLSFHKPLSGSQPIPTKIGYK